MKTVRYNNMVWIIDIANNNLVLKGDGKTQVDIDEVFNDLSDGDQNKIAEASAIHTDNLSVTEDEEEFEEEF